MQRPVGHGFITLPTIGEAERAISELSGKKFLGRKIAITLAREEKAKQDEASKKRDYSSEYVNTAGKKGTY
jgi:RNA recognition motif-containing protein